MHFAQLLQDFAVDIGWKDQVERIEDEGICRLAVRLSIGGRSYRLMIEGHETREWLALYLYAPFTVREDKLVDACMLFNFINGSFSYSGSINGADDGIISYKQLVDLGGCTADMALIYNMLHAAVDMFERNAAELEAVAASDLRYEEVRREMERNIARQFQEGSQEAQG
ncbi:MAG: YbjN domain-containing protein [Chlorobium sp.]|uniref:YbjN domain-containing protein n=1 Tax=Chlorobium sp. TaxID=1095 RepID=UPI0025BF0344|nr:YbjN domain-containing protein [Chlorobium sp.]MCF8383581.1 YbjN domain-containing protein [Chlorobium sp.]